MRTSLPPLRQRTDPYNCSHGDGNGQADFDTCSSSYTDSSPAAYRNCNSGTSGNGDSDSQTNRHSDARAYAHRDTNTDATSRGLRYAEWYATESSQGYEHSRRR